MTTQSVIAAIEAQIKAANDALHTQLATWRDQQAEGRTATESRMRSIEESIGKLTAEREEKRRYSLPGSEPGSNGKDAFSLRRAVQAIVTRDWSNAGFEQEVFENMRKRAMSSGIDASGGFIVPDEAIPQVIERLKAQVIAFQLGAREMNATAAPIRIPRISTSVTASWVSGENETITDSDMGLQEITLSPKTLAARTVVSNQLLELSMPAADTMIEGDMASQLAIGLDKGIIEGTGASGQPLGIINDANVGTESTSAGPTFEQLTGFIDELANNNSLKGKLGWAMHPSVFTTLMKLKSANETAGTPSLDVTRHAVTERAPDSILSYPYATTTSFTASSGAGSLIFGNWDDVLVALWGGLRLSANMFGDSAFSKDQTHIRAIMRADTALRHAESFCVSV